jgi:hypothetical protein
MSAEQSLASGRPFSERRKSEFAEALPDRDR